MATNPTLITTPFAQSGDKTTPPNTNTPSDGRFSQTLGFPPVTAIPLGSGGKAPKREDFNGALNMLANIAFYAQKGFIFNWDNGQSYYKGCLVIDSTDGNYYVCLSDVAAGAAKPSLNSAKWKQANLTSSGGGYNTRDVVTTSGTYTASVDGWYKITVKGGGGGGGGGGNASMGGGGGEGGTTIAYEYMTASQTATVVIGAGGGGGSANTIGSNGGNSTVTVNGHTHTGGGGKGGVGGSSNSFFYGDYGNGGTGTINGAAGGSRIVAGSATYGGHGGGAGGGVGNPSSSATAASGTQGGGGAGGVTTSGGSSGGGGGNGFAWFEYFAAV